MKAVVYREYGPPDVLQLEEVEKPAPAEHEVLVQVQAAAANPLDWHAMRGAPFIARLESGFLKPKRERLGADIAGRVEAVGTNVTQFQLGDEVFGDLSDSGLGGFGEYVCVGEHLVAPKPATMTFEQAAAVPVAAITVLQGMRDKGQIQAGQRVLINGASGGLGTFAVQLAKSFGAEVTGVCSTRNVELVRSLGADHVIDYTRDDFTTNGLGYDLIIDNVGNRSVSDYKRALGPTGQCVIIGFTTLGRLFQHIFVGAMASSAQGKRIVGLGASKPNKNDLLFLKELLEAGIIAPVIDKRYPLSEVAEAIRYLETGHARGKVVINIGSD